MPINRHKKMPVFEKRRASNAMLQAGLQTGPPGLSTACVRWMRGLTSPDRWVFFVRESEFLPAHASLKIKCLTYFETSVAAPPRDPVYGSSVW